MRPADSLLRACTLLAALLSRPIAAQDSLSIGVGEVRHGRLTVESARTGGGHYLQAYVFQALPGVRYIATVASDEVFPYLSLAREGAADGELLEAEGYPAATVMSWRIQFRVGEAGSHALLAQAPYVGSFTLTLDTLPRWVPAASPLTTGTVVTGDLAPGDGQLDPFQGGYYDLYSFPARTGEVFCIRMSSADFEPMFAVGDTAHGAFVEFGRGVPVPVESASEVRLRWKAPWSGEFQLRPTTLGLIPGRYRLALEPGPGICPPEETHEEDPPGAAARGSRPAGALRPADAWR